MKDSLVDDIIKILVALAVVAGFVYILIWHEGEDKFEMLSSIGGFVGMILMYYFKDKKNFNPFNGGSGGYTCDKCKK